MSSKTIIDIAEKANLSKSTVSRVLSGTGSVSKKAKEKVLSIAKELNYQPNTVARAMITKKTGIIGVVMYGKHMPMLEHPFYSSIIDAIAMEAQKHGYGILMMADAELAGEQSFARLMGHKVDGFILMSRVPKHLIVKLQQQHIPFVLVNNTEFVKDASYIVNDDYLGAYDAAGHLIDRGYTNIGYISGPLDHRSYRLRWEGFQAALSANGIEIKPHHRFIGDSVFESGWEGLNAILEHNDSPDAIFASNDMMAIGALHASHSRGLAIPQDIAIMGFDNIEFSKYTIPPLTTVHVDNRQIGRMAFNKLFAIIKNETDKNSKIIIPGQVIQRKTT